MRRCVWLGVSALTLLLAYVACPFRIGIVCGTSMEPTFHSGQPILIDQNYYRRHAVARGDVVLLRQEGQTLIKRVFACEGDAFHVLIVPDEESVNRYIIGDADLPRVKRTYCTQSRRGMARLSRVRIPTGHVYVLGDNANASVDSRDFGCVSIRSIIGRVPGPVRGTPTKDGVQVAHADLARSTRD
jgi:signal peptidase I